MTKPGLRLCSCVLWLTFVWGCGGSAPPAPVANPYSSGGNSAPDQPTPAPVQPQGNPFGGPSSPATAGSGNPFGGPAPAPVTPPDPPAAENSVVMETPAKSVEPAMTPRRGPPVKPVKPVPAATTKPEPMPEPVPMPDPTTPKPDPGTPEPLPATTPEPDPKPASVATNWSLTVDPVPTGIHVTKSHKLALVKVPQFGALGPDFVEAGRLRVLYSATPGVAVAIGLNDETKQYRDVWDFVTKKKIGTIRNLQLSGAKGQAISPDGRFFAFKPQWDPAVQILDLVSGKKSTTPKLAGSASKLVAFAGATRLIYEDKGEIRIHAAPEFEFKTFVKPAGWSPDDGWALSPSGKYLAAIRKVKGGSAAEFFDLDTGESAGKLTLAEAGTCLGLAFSPDGKQLAAWIDGAAPALKKWQVADGAIAGQHDLTAVAGNIEPHESYQGQRVEWFPNGRHVLLGGRVVFDAEEGIIATITGGDEKPLSAVRVIGPQQTLASIDGQMSVVDLSESMKITTTVAGTTPGSPGSPARTEPAATPADRSGITLAFPDDVEWTVKLSKPLPVSKVSSRGIKLPVGNVYMGRLSPTQGTGMVMYTSTPLALGDDGLPTFEAATRFWIQPVDLKASTLPKIIPLPASRLLMSMTPSAGHICLRNTDGLDRLEILATKDGSREGAFAPYHDAPPGPEQRVTYAEFTDATHLVTKGAGRLTHWEYKTAKAVFEYEVGGMRPEISPGRDYLAVTDPGSRTISLINLAIGKPEGTIVVSDLVGEEAAACSFHAGGRYFATLSRRNDGGELRVIDLVDGTERKRFPLPISAQVMQWVGDDYLLLNGSALVSVTRACVVWNYGLPQGMHVLDSPDQRHWYIAADPDRSNAIILRGVDMPDGTALERIGAASPKGRLLLGPEKLISLSVEVADPEGETGFAKKVTGFLTDRYAGAKITVQEKSDVELTVRDTDGGWKLSMMNDGKTLWEHTIDGTDGPSALLEYEPPKHAFPFGSAQGAGQSDLNIRGVD